LSVDGAASDALSKLLHIISRLLQ